MKQISSFSKESYFYFFKVVFVLSYYDLMTRADTALTRLQWIQWIQLLEDGLLVIVLVFLKQIISQLS